jgi:hypothetical protein
MYFAPGKFQGIRDRQYPTFASRGFVFSLILVFVTLAGQGRHHLQLRRGVPTPSALAPMSLLVHKNAEPPTVSTPLATGTKFGLPCTSVLLSGWHGLTLDRAGSTGPDFRVSTDSQRNISGGDIYTYRCTANCGTANYTESFIETSNTLGFEISRIDQVYGLQSLAHCGDAPFCESGGVSLTKLVAVT